MVIGITLIIVLALIVFIWMFVELKRFKHKLFAIFLIFIILFAYFGFVSSIKGKDIDLKTVDGLKVAGGLYLSWLGGVFHNTKIITSNAIAMDWQGDNSTDVGK